MLTLQVTSRDIAIASDILRAQGTTPAVLYGPKESPVSISINTVELSRAWREAGETTLVVLERAGEKKETLIHDVQIHPVTGNILHADFYVLEKGKLVEVSVPLHFVGEAPAEKSGFIIVKALHEIDIAVAAAELPHHLDVDVSTLVNVGDHLTVADVKLPASATLQTNDADIVASVTEFKEVNAEAQLPTAADLAAPVAPETTDQKKDK
jgi:large subunit ribosomal protein L25